MTSYYIAPSRGHSMSLDLTFLMKFESNNSGNQIKILQWKESLNNGVYQFHQYQQNERLPLILAELT